jgi:hypothetical protein
VTQALSMHRTLSPCLQLRLFLFFIITHLTPFRIMKMYRGLCAVRARTFCLRAGCVQSVRRLHVRVRARVRVCSDHTVCVHSREFAMQKIGSFEMWVLGLAYFQRAITQDEAQAAGACLTGQVPLLSVSSVAHGLARACAAHANQARAFTLVYRPRPARVAVRERP